MGWKEWSSWVKGGIISTVLLSLLVILVFIFYNPQVICSSWKDCPTVENLWIISFIYALLNDYLFVPLESFFRVGGMHGSNNLTGRLTGLVFMIVYFFGIGAVIGWIVGKMRGGKKHAP